VLLLSANDFIKDYAICVPKRKVIFLLVLGVFYFVELHICNFGLQ